MGAYLTFTDRAANSNKFYNLQLDLPLEAVKGSLVITYGRRGTAGQTFHKDFSTFGEACEFAETLLRQKLRKGYRDAEVDWISVLGGQLRSTRPVYTPLRPLIAAFPLVPDEEEV